MPKKIEVPESKLNQPASGKASRKLKAWNTYAQQRIAQARASERLSQKDFSVRINAK